MEEEEEEEDEEEEEAKVLVKVRKAEQALRRNREERLRAERKAMDQENALDSHAAPGEELGDSARRCCVRLQSLV